MIAEHRASGSKYMVSKSSIVIFPEMTWSRLKIAATIDDIPLPIRPQMAIFSPGLICNTELCSREVDRDLIEILVGTNYLITHNADVD
jgi:hypothetical protein